jgi:hypothetical protein
MHRWLFFTFLLTNPAFGQGVTFKSSDSATERAFQWAKAQALAYRGKPGDPVGPWYEAALPSRNAFCMRDVSHQAIGAAILGMEAENKNMFTLFARNISGSKNWCSYWEINKYGVAAPEDYRSDREFWYNLNANFDLLYATWRLAAWTGDSSYYQSPVITKFQEMTVGPYISAWKLAADSLLVRPSHPNAPVPYHEKDAFDRCRGLPSYSEGIPNIRVGVDLVAAIYRGLITYSEVLRQQGWRAEATAYADRAEQYLLRLEKDWWDDSAARYHTWYSEDGHFGKGEGETFLLWFDAMRDTARARRTIGHLASANWNVENSSYLGYLFYREGYWDTARKTILYLADPSTKRREYPEVSFGVVQGVVLGLMGVDVLPGTRTVTTLYRSRAVAEASLEGVPVLGISFSISHFGTTRSVASNHGLKEVTWRAEFDGPHVAALVNGKPASLQQQRDRWGHVLSFVDLSLGPGQSYTVAVQ